MASIPPLWVYKCNASKHSRQMSQGDWSYFFTLPQPHQWGGSMTMRSASSLDILRNRMAAGDLVLAWQTNRRRAVGLCRVRGLDDWPDGGETQRAMILELVGEPFSPPVPLLDMRRQDEQLGRVRAFRQGQVSTLYETSPGEAAILLRSCGVTARTLALVSSSPRPPLARRGAGFGTPAENKKVEQAAVEVFKRHYRAWKLDDFQKDGVGYDFCARRGNQERHVEIKGVRGPSPSVIITNNEVATAEGDARWRLCVVTDALSAKPKLREWTAAEFLDQFDRVAISYMATLRK